MLMFQKGRWALPVALVLLSAVMRGAPITVIPTVTANGSLSRYNYSITNPTGNDLAVLDLIVTPGAATIQNLITPAGFKSAYDPVLGLVSFLEDTAFFGATSLSGFAFDSPFRSGPTTFTGTLVDANFNVSTATGATTGPVVPEPGYLPLLALGAPLFWFLQRRGRHFVTKRYNPNFKDT
jgi:hypothetical protein